MESNEEYLLRALRRTSSGLVDSLIPAHGAKLSKLVEKFEMSDSLEQEVRTLLKVQGFGKCALAMEWLLERTKRSDDNFIPEQFESDILLLNEKLFEAFLNQPFDMPDYSRTTFTPSRSTHQDFQISDDEFVAAQGNYDSPSEQNSFQSLEDTTQQENINSPFSNEFSESYNTTSESIETSNSQLDDAFLTTAHDEIPSSFESALISPQLNEISPSDSTPSLTEAFDSDLFESSQRVAQSAIEFFDKMPGERPISMAVLRVSARSASESAKATSNLIAVDFYDALLRLISYADEQGKIRSDIFAEVVRDIGDRLNIALQEKSGGLTLLKNITKFISDPKDLLSK